MSDEFRKFTGREIETGVPLAEYIGGTANHAVFRTSFSGDAAAVKLFALDPATADALLARLQSLERVSHPNLLRVLRVGRGEIDGTAFVYIVTEFAEENLAQVLPERALTPEETREVLKSCLDALAYLHEQGFVHSDIKPANILARGNQLKVSVDSLHRSGESLSRQFEAHDAPEATQALTPASDIWSLGMTLVEVLTQKVPAKPENPNAGPAVDESVPAPFREIAQHCLLRTQELRWGIKDIRAKLGLNDKQAPVPAVVRNEAPRVVPTARPGKSKRPVIFVVVVLLVAAALAVFTRHSDRKDEPQPPQVNLQASATQTTTQQTTPPANAESQTTASKEKPETETTKATSPPTKSAAERADSLATKAATDATGEKHGPVHEVMPKVLPAAQRSIEGKVRVKMALDVDSAGRVTGCRFVSPGPSKYFARISEEAARQWKFVPASTDSRLWQVEFEFRPEGTTVQSKQQHE